MDNGHILTNCCNLQRQLGSFDNIFKGNGRGRASPNSLNETFYFLTMSLVLLEQGHLLEPRKAVPGQLSEIIQVKDLASAENLDPLFGIHLAAIGKIMDCGNGTVIIFNPIVVGSKRRLRWRNCWIGLSPLVRT